MALSQAMTFLQAGQLDEAEALFRRILAANPNTLEALHYYGVLLDQTGRPDKAERMIRKAIKLRPDYAEAYNNLGKVMHGQMRFAEEVTCYRKALAINDGYPETHCNLGYALRELGRMEEAKACFRRVLELQPGHPRARFALCVCELPILYTDTEALRASRKNYRQALTELEAYCEDAALRPALWPGVGTSHPFFLSYQGEVDREEQRAYGRIVAGVMTAAFPNATAAPPAPPGPGEKIRVGVVCGLFSSHSVWKLPTRGWVEQMDRSRFQLFGYHTRSTTDEETAVARRLMDRFVQGPLSVQDWCREIRSDRPHVLIYPEIGMEAMSARLAALRLAPVQCTSWGHPDTSGLPTMDYYLSSDLMEPADADAHYSEKLIRLPNLSVYFEPPEFRPVPISRRKLGLRDGAVVYWCCQSLKKYLPDYDTVFPRIAARMPDSQFVFLSYGRGDLVDTLFKERLERAFAAHGLKAADYCHMLPKLTFDQFVAAAGLVDVGLDSIGWSGCNSTLESIVHNLPIVTLPGTTMRARHTAAILRMMGVTDTIVDSLDDYVELAVRLGGDPDFRKTVSRRMGEGRPRLYRDDSCVRGLEAFLIKVVG